MPNHVKNVLKFKNLKPEDIDLIVNTIAVKAEDDSGYWIDFDKIIPEPKTKSECPEDCLVNKDSHVMEYKDRPWFDWYTWHNKYWDTKWSAYDCYSQKGLSYIMFVFSTAWSMPYKVIKRLHLLVYDFELRYADEDYGSNCGKLFYNKEEGFTHYDESDLANPEQFAERLWRNY